MVEVRRLELEGVLELRPKRYFDERGFFSEVWRDEWQAEAGLDVKFVQDNHSYSRSRGVLRGLHFQTAPAAQAKLVRVARGAIFDVAVDIRDGSPTFGRWTGIRLSAEDWNQLFIPQGFAHGFVTTEDDTEVLYKTSAPYAPALERCIRFDDPSIGVNWPAVGELIVSEKDRCAPSLADTELSF